MASSNIHHLETIDDGPPAKRQKTQACMRCRQRKQKCESSRPCSNCLKSNTACHEVLPPTVYAPMASPFPIGGETQPEPLATFATLASLQDRISRLEEQRNRLELENASTARCAPTKTILPSYATPRREDEAASSPSWATIGLLSTFARSPEEAFIAAQSGDAASPSVTRQVQQQQQQQQQQQLPRTDIGIDYETQQTLFDIYNDKVQCRYPFLRLHQYRDPSPRQHDDPTFLFIINLIFSIGLLLHRNPQSLCPLKRSQDFYRIAVTQYLSHVFAQPKRLLHIQAYLLLAMHAMYSPSTERIISIASATMRYCVMAQLHSSDAEPRVVNDDNNSVLETKIEIQMRRRVFWSAYALDRTVGTMFDLPFSIPDAQITVKMYSNIEDSELETRLCPPYPFPSSSSHHQHRPLTDVSAALHVVYCRQIQSEILNTTLHRDFSPSSPSSSWRLNILSKLNKWKSLCHRYSSFSSFPSTSSPSDYSKEKARKKTFTSNEWLHMIYNYSLAMLHQPTNPEGRDWTMRACVQALLIFRRFQRETGPTTELWLGLIAQFKCGVALLYCVFYYRGQARSRGKQEEERNNAGGYGGDGDVQGKNERGKESDGITRRNRDIGWRGSGGGGRVSEAVRACGVTLSLLAERWPGSAVLRDVFDVLAREVFDRDDDHHKDDRGDGGGEEEEEEEEEEGNDKEGGRRRRNKKRMRKEASAELLGWLSQVEMLVVHRGTVSMIREMATKPFPETEIEQEEKSGRYDEELRENRGASDHETQPEMREEKSRELHATGRNDEEEDEEDSHSWRTGATEDFFQPFTPHLSQFDLSSAGLDGATGFGQGGDEVLLGFPGDLDFTTTF